jgi:hypothetical protein
LILLFYLLRRLALPFPLTMLPAMAFILKKEPLLRHLLPDYNLDASTQMDLISQREHQVQMDHISQQEHQVPDPQNLLDPCGPRVLFVLTVLPDNNHLPSFHRRHLTTTSKLQLPTLIND